MTTPLAAPLVLVSNRGPVTFQLDANGDVTERRGAGGLVSGLGSLAGHGCTWIAAAITDGDRVVAAGGPRDSHGFTVHLIDVPTDQWSDHYDAISNETLWFVHHGLFDPPHTPRFDDRWRAAWANHLAVNERFADHIAATSPPGATVLVQDYHLAVLGSMLRTRRPDLRTVHFHHTPFASAEELAALPTDVIRTLLHGLAGFDACGFHTPVWQARFTRALTEFGVTPPPTFWSPLAIDVEDITAVAASDQCRTERARLDELIGDAAFIARVDRIELSKNLLRGFDAFELLLERNPERCGNVVFGAFCYPSREGVEAYRAYHAAVVARVERLNERWGTADWTPVVLETTDNFPRSVAALTRSDVLLINPVRDGLNLVALEGALVNERHGGLVLSRTAGAWHQLSHCADGVHPFDVSETATALGRALDRHRDDRVAHAAARHAVATGRTTDDWLQAQLGALDRA